MQHLLLFHGNNGYQNAPHYYVYTYTYIACLFFCFNQNWSVPINFKYTSKYLMKLHEYSFWIFFMRTYRQRNGEILTDAAQGWELAYKRDCQQKDKRIESLTCFFFFFL
jgi:hypothetical protein